MEVVMPIEAKLSRYKRNNWVIIIVVLAGLGIWCIRDGYYNEKFIEKNTTTNEAGEEVQGEWLIVNQKAPPFLFAGAIAAAIYLFLIKGKKVIAADTSLITEKLEIPYDNIEQIDKTNFDSKGYFVLTYKDSQGSEQTLRLSDRTYDNLPAVLDEIVKQIT